MKTSCTGNYTAIAGKIMLGLALAAMLGAVDVVPADARPDRDRVENHDNRRMDNRGRGYDHGRYRNGRGEYRTYGYRERVYAPPAVIYAPPQPPGISLFFPPIIFRP
jgi:hypothetical protein